MVGDRHRLDLGSHRRARRMDGRRRADAQRERRAEWWRAGDRDGRSDRGDRRGVAWSASHSTVPTTGLIAAGADGQTNGWGQWFTAPATAGTFYLWTLAQGAGAVTSGALVTSAITVA